MSLALFFGKASLTHSVSQSFWLCTSQDPGLLFRLRRYNGKSHEHTNHIEGDRFYDFHIHMATERYQDIGSREDAYAMVTDGYTDIEGAIHRMFEDAEFDVPPADQLSLL